MTRKILYILSFGVLSLVSVYAQDEGVSFEAIPSKTNLGVNERLRINFEINKDGDNFVPPDFEGFTIVSGPNQSVSRSWINGKSSYKKTYSYFLSPLGKGTFVIKQASVEIEEKIYKTTPIKITITKAVDGSNNNFGFASSERKIYLVAEISNSNPYINEALSIIYKLYYENPNLGLQINQENPPDYRNFLNQKVSIDRLVANRGVYKGKYYNYVIFHKAVLYPQKSGQIKIDPMSIDVTVNVPNGRVDFFGSMMYNRVRKNIASSVRRIDVKPLPSVGRPKDFSGAVGQFVFSTHISRTSLKATESLQATLKLSGKGNMHSIKLPKPSMPSSIEVYEPESKESLKTTISGTQGEISDSYTLVPQYKGTFRIPRIKFSYFNPKINKYISKYSKALSFEVTQGPNISTTSSPSTPAETAINKQKVATTSSKHLHFIKTHTKFQSIASISFINSYSFFILLLLPFVIIPIIILIYHKNKRLSLDSNRIKIKKADGLAKKYLSTAKKQIGQEESFYIALEKSLYNFLKAKIKLEIFEFSKDKIKNILLQKEVEQTLVDEFINLINDCEMARYTPTSKPANKEDYNRAVKIISQIDKQI